MISMNWNKNSQSKKKKSDIFINSGSLILGKGVLFSTISSKY